MKLLASKQGIFCMSVSSCSITNHTTHTTLLLSLILRCILSFPIRDESGIIGVAQLCNKIGGLYFDVYDEEVCNLLQLSCKPIYLVKLSYLSLQWLDFQAAVAFSIYCGISIMHSLVYKKIQDAQARSKLANEMMIYHMQVNLLNLTCLFILLCPLI